MSIHALARKDGSSEFTCIDCGTHVVRIAGHHTEARCATCINIPGWQDNPILRNIFLNEDNEERS